MALDVATRVELNDPERSSKTARLRNDVIAAIERFAQDDMRVSWSNALEALAVAGLDAMRRRKPLRDGLRPRGLLAPASDPDPDLPAA